MVYKRRLESVREGKSILEKKEGRKSKYGTNRQTEECAV
jgi:hypothetical protein